MQISKRARVSRVRTHERPLHSSRERALDATGGGEREEGRVGGGGGGGCGVGVGGGGGGGGDGEGGQGGFVEKERERKRVVEPSGSGDASSKQALKQSSATWMRRHVAVYLSRLLAIDRARFRSIVVSLTLLQIHLEKEES
ncbi:hypothetical protein V1477_020974 [Vespula maculifrons]|uniref:Uncharacterized protein n=1 Tax=Vespula maculifrons TaxID=7453 RepID=A0ABD2ANG7_VESMC